MATIEWWRDLLREWGPWIEAAKYAFSLLGLLFAIVFVPLYRWVRRLIEQRKILIKQRDDAETGNDEPREAAAPGATFANWEQVRAMWRSVRRRTEGAILNLHGNARRKFLEENWHSYGRIAEMLHRDGKLSIEGAAALRELDRLALGKRRSRAATDEEVGRARALYDILDDELPPKGEEE